jgi:hypothetical protein
VLPPPPDQLRGYKCTYTVMYMQRETLMLGVGVREGEEEGEGPAR